MVDYCTFSESESEKEASKAIEEPKQERNFADYIVYLSIVAVTSFTIAAFALQFKGQMEISTTLTTCWFGFWTAEIIALAAIRTKKVRYNYDSKNKNKEE